MLRFAAMERQLFARINKVVEPAVRCGVGSSVLAPASLIVLQTLGVKRGKLRSTPLWSWRLGRYRIVGTVRGKRYFWVKNLQQQPQISYYLGGIERHARAVIISNSLHSQSIQQLRPALGTLLTLIARHAPAGWTFAVLVPATH